MLELVTSFLRHRCGPIAPPVRGVIEARASTNGGTHRRCSRRARVCTTERQRERAYDYLGKEWVQQMTLMRIVLAALFVSSSLAISPTAARADDADAQYNACKDHLTDTDPTELGAADMSCMDAATQYDAKAHAAALAGRTYDRDRYRLLAGTCYVAAGQIETRIGDNEDAHDDFLKGAVRLKEAASSRYPNIAQAAINLLNVATGQ